VVREQWQWGVRFVASPPLADVVAATSHRTGRPAQAHHPAAVGLRRGAGDHRTVDVRTAVSTFLFPWSMQELGSGTTMLIAAGLCALGGVVSQVLAPETAGRTLNEIVAAENR
jgi:hypothetical protein